MIEPHHNMIGADFGESREDAGSDPPSWPVLADHALYGVVRSIVGASTEESEADPTAVLATLLTHVGVFIGRGPFVRVGDDHHHARLFCAIVGQSTRGRKGTSEAPVRRLGEFADKRCGPLAWKPGPMSSGEGLIHAIRDGDGKADAGVADKRLLIVEGELADPLRAMQRNGNTLSTVLRATWDGRTLEPLTKANVIKVSNPHVGIVGHITIAEMKELLGRVEIFNGFANRFLWWCVRRAKLVPLARGMTEADVGRLGAEYAGRLSAARRIGEVQFSNEARSLYQALYPDLTADHGGLYGVVTARAEAQVIRLALTYALLDGSNLISVQHLMAALAVWEFCDNSARYLFGEAQPDPIEARILALLETGPKTTSELHRAMSGHIPVEKMKAALANLQGRGRIDQINEPTPGRPRAIWTLRQGFQRERSEKGEIRRAHEPYFALLA